MSIFPCTFVYVRESTQTMLKHQDAASAGMDKDFYGQHLLKRLGLDKNGFEYSHYLLGEVVK